MSTIICRCEHVSEETIRQVMRDWGAVSANEIKLISRAGKGLCQGRCCFDLVSRIVSQATGTALRELPPPSVRAPVHPIPMSVLGTADDPGLGRDGYALSLQTVDPAPAGREGGDAHGR